MWLEHRDLTPAQGIGPGIGQKILQDDTRNINFLDLMRPYIRCLTVPDEESLIVLNIGAFW